MVYKIMLVDDEEEVRESIIKRIDWETLGFRVVGDAENGEDALEKIYILDPDVIMTDIQMPYMDGLTMTERIKKEYPDKQIVIFSGYNDFEYAKQAIKLGVTEYILKPINSEELTDILKNLKKKLDDRLNEKRNMSLLMESYRKNFPVLKEKFLNEWMEDGLKEAELVELLDEYTPELLEVNRWVAVRIYIEAKKQGVLTEKELWPISVGRIIDDYLEGKHQYVRFNYRREIGVIVALGKDEIMDEVISAFNIIGKECEQIFSLTISVGIGNEKYALGEIPTSFREAREALGYRSVVGPTKAVWIKDVEPKNEEVLILGAQEVNDITHALKFDGEDAVVKIITNVVMKMDESVAYSRQSQSYAMSLLNVVLQFIWQNELDEQEILGSGKDCYGEFTRIGTREGILEFMLMLCRNVHKQIEKKRQTTAVDIIKEAQEYIDRNYTNPDLSVEMLCNHLHLSQSYFSTVFKKETGQNYVSYLTEVRLNKAVELLNTTDDKTYIIASKVGYAEPNYFSYVFKKRFGVSPSKYKGKA